MATGAAGAAGAAGLEARAWYDESGRVRKERFRLPGGWEVTLLEEQWPNEEASPKVGPERTTKPRRRVGETGSPETDDGS